MGEERWKAKPEGEDEENPAEHTELSDEEQILKDASQGTKLAEEAAKTAKANKERMEAEAAEAKAQADKQAAEAKVQAEKEANTLGLTLPQFRDEKAKVLQLNAKYEIALEENRQEQEERDKEKKVWNKHISALEETLETKESNEYLLKEEILRLRNLIGEQEEQEEQAKDDGVHYKQNIERAIALLGTIVNGIEEFSPDLKTTLDKKIAKLEEKLDFEYGMPIIMACHTAIITEAGYFQDNTFKGYDGDVVADWLFKKDEELEKLMRLKVEDAVSDEPPPFTPPASTGFGKLLDRVAETIKKGIG